MIRLAFSEIEIASLGDFWDRYSIDDRPETLRYFGWRGKSRTNLTIVPVPEHALKYGHLGVAGVDWGRPPLLLLQACPIVQTAALMLLDATRLPESVLAAFEFAADFLRTCPNDWVVSAKYVRDWYAAELAELESIREPSGPMEGIITFPWRGD